MATQERFAGSDSSPAALIERIRSFPAETFWVRLVVWSAVVVGVSLAVQRFTVGHVSAAGGELLAPALAVGICAGLAMGAYCFVRFALGAPAPVSGGQVRFLLASAGFSALGFGALLQDVADFRCAEAAAHAWISTSSWLAASVLFAGAAYSNTVWRRSTRYEALQHFLLAVIAVCAFPVAAAPYALDTSLLCELGGVHHESAAALAVDVSAGFAATLLMVAALLGLLRKLQVDEAEYRSGDGRFFALMCHFLAPCAVGLVLRTGSCERFSGMFQTGEMILAGSWVALMIRAGVENAFAHRESADRLRELDNLHQVSWSLVGAGTAAELLNLFVNTLVEKVGAKISAVYLADESRENLQLAAIAGCDAPRFPVGTLHALRSAGRYPGFHSGHTAEAFRTGEIKIARDVFVDVEFVPWRQIAVDDGAAASFPLVRRGETIGVLNVYFSDYRQLSAQKVKLISTIATAATPAIENAVAREQSSGPCGECRTLDAAA